MTPRASELAASVLDNVSKVQQFLDANNLPSLSINNDVPIQLQANQDFANPRDAAILACKELLALLAGSFGVLAGQTTTEFANTQAICRFKIAENFPEGSETTTFEELAETCRMPESEVRRIVRASLPSYIFQEKGKGVIQHTAASKLLAKNPLMREWIEMTASEIHPAALRYADAMEKWPGSEEPNQTGYNVANGTDEVPFVHMAKFPGRPERFAAAMALFSKGPGYSPRWLLDNYPWDRIGAGTVVDVGGSNGDYSIPIAQKYKSIKCVIQDLPEVVTKADSRLPDDLRERVSFKVHDFFKEQPLKGAEVYLLRWVLHDWSDKYAINILRALIPALKKESKILLHEYILPEPGELPTIQDRTLRIFDTSMRALTNGKEREARDWVALITTADPRFRVERIETPVMSSLGIIEVGWDG